MTRELKTILNNTSITAYISEGFFNFQPMISELHNHPFTEIQIVISGEAHFWSFNQTFIVKKMQMIVIPANCFHENIYFEQDTQIICFQIDYPIDSCKIISFSDNVPQLFSNEIKKFVTTNTSNKLPIYLSLILSELIKKGTDPTINVQNRSFLIHDFLTNNFAKNVSLLDLANLLCVSEKQTERLVKKYTGNTFREELVRLRMEAAHHLINSTDLTLSEIAEKVGYQSYSGFWKAYNIYQRSL